MAWSGGKDSSLALAALRRDPSIEIVGLLTAVTTDYQRVSIHGTRVDILQAQARLLDLPLFLAQVRAVSDNAAYEAAWANALSSAREALGPITSIAYGDLFLQDIRAYRERQCAELNVEPLFPLWGEPTSQLAQRAVRDGYVAYLTCVDTSQLDASFAGRVYDAALLSDLPTAVDPCGERGEFHTCVVAAPIYNGHIAVRPGERVLRESRFQFADLVLVA
jgi:uncharacterized protein (TIGR00290 family)